jgi:hypothetical protein
MLEEWEVLGFSSEDNKHPALEGKVLYCKVEGIIGSHW